MSTQRLSLTRNGQVRYEFKTPCSDGTTHVILEPLDFIARLVVQGIDDTRVVSVYESKARQHFMPADEDAR